MVADMAQYRSLAGEELGERTGSPLREFQFSAKYVLKQAEGSICNGLKEHLVLKDSRRKRNSAFLELFMPLWHGNRKHAVWLLDNNVRLN